MMMIILYIVGLLGFLYYMIFARAYNHWKIRGVQFDKPFSVFGNFYSLATGKQSMLERIRDIYSQYKTPYVGIFIFNQPYLMVRSPELVKKILVKDFDKFVNRNIATKESIDPIAFHTLGSAKDKTWRNLRSKLSPVFTSGKMKLMFPLMKECAQELNSCLNNYDGKTVEVANVIKRYSVDIISSCAFGIKAYCLKDENSEILKMAIKLLDTRSFVRNFSIFSAFFVPKFVEIFRLTLADKSASKYFIDVFNATLKEREKKNIVRNDLIDLLNNLRKNENIGDGYIFDDIKMAAQAIVFFSAGNDTTATSLSFALYELALNQEIQDRLRREVKEHFDRAGDFTYETLQEMKYLNMVLKETFRKYPVTPFLSRKSTAPYTFEETGLTIEKDTLILIPVPGLHYDPEYFPDPEKFDPERFSDENKHNVNPYAYLPFGEGPRNCIGERFANLVSKLALASMIKDFVFEVTNETEIPIQLNPRAVFTQSKGGIKLRVRKIKS
ncbi:p450 domain containing protein [Asbolus verrucosus]|uniref:p450 domain containing protein n=1 Tax=Asbolus verrucosus TaxID=1661398 RepID=A0A482VG83_ASBVE|nr:p450 domain containing protein [Asbolus verrucosus]